MFSQFSGSLFGRLRENDAAFGAGGGQFFATGIAAQRLGEKFGEYIKKKTEE